MFHRNIILTTLLLLVATISMSAQVPDKPTEKKLLWDFANVIDDAQEKAIEDSLEAFSRHTSNQILVMTVTSLGNFEPVEYATELGRKWGVGHKENNNGVVVLIKVKTENEKGQAFIATGYGSEGPLPDVLCNHIVEKEMIPKFKEDDYAGGVWNALAVIMPAMKGEFNVEEYVNDDSGDALLAIIVMIAILAFMFYAISKSNGTGNGTGTNTRTYTGGPIIFPGSFGSGSSRGSWGSGSGGGFGGGWGGFGGGSFGGGGGGGSW